MQISLLARFSLAATGLLACTAQAQSPTQNVSTAAPLTALPFGAKDDKPVSKWTPPATVGRQLTVNDLLSWKGVRTPQLSNDGKWFAYVIAPNEGDAEVVVRSTAAGAKEMRFPIGDASAGGAGAGRGGGGSPSIAISGNAHWVAFLEYASSATIAGRGGRGGRGGAGVGGGDAPAAAVQTKLAVVNLTDGTKREFENVRAFRFAGDKSDWIAVHRAAPRGVAVAPAAGGASTGVATGSTLELVNLAGGMPTPISDVTEFAFDDAGDWVAFAIATADQAGNSVQLRQLSSGMARTLDVKKASYRRLTWGDSSDALIAYRVVTDTQRESDRTEREICGCAEWVGVE